jgi:hypothetical protein
VFPPWRNLLFRGRNRDGPHEKARLKQNCCVANKLRLTKFRACARILQVNFCTVCLHGERSRAAVWLSGGFVPCAPGLSPWQTRARLPSRSHHRNLARPTALSAGRFRRYPDLSQAKLHKRVTAPQQLEPRLRAQRDFSAKMPRKRGKPLRQKGLRRSHAFRKNQKNSAKIPQRTNQRVSYEELTSKCLDSAELPNRSAVGRAALGRCAPRSRNPGYKSLQDWELSRK